VNRYDFAMFNVLFAGVFDFLQFLRPSFLIATGSSSAQMYKCRDYIPDG
jgi:hypothetical protein